jgi:ADP-ribose pyrophosphatase
LKRPKLLKEEILEGKYGKNPILRDFKLPSGKIFDFYCFNGVVSVIVLPLTKNNEVVAIKQFRFAANSPVIEIPGGNKGKLTAERCAQKELADETGYVSKQIHIFKKVWIDPAALVVPFIPALAIKCEQKQQTKLDETELTETLLIPLNKWQDMIMSGEVNDSKTIATTFLALKYLGLL